MSSLASQQNDFKQLLVEITNLLDAVKELKIVLENIEQAVTSLKKGKNNG